ncbi:MAG: DEAD/DEAH box helicase [Chloroflexi bacterium]|nr:DEAD/DEAH box helicase [Chloroflexota bacterium]
MQFDEFNLNKALQSALRDQGYEETTRVQTQAIAPALEGRDIIGCAPTGTGKTVAYLLPTLQRLLNEPSQRKNPRVLILVPTRELAVQVAGEAEKLARGTAVRVAAVYGGAGIKAQISLLRRGIDIVVATPGRLLDHMRRRNLSFRDLEVLVLDEADRMLDMGFLPDVELIMRRMPRDRQTMLFSATIPAPVAALARDFQRDPVQIEIDMARPPESIQQAIYPVPKHLKTKLIIAMLDQLGVSSMLLFTRTKQEADIVARHLRESSIAVSCIHGDFSQRERTAALEGFRSGKYRVLVATNVAARGLDVEGISHVVNYDVPDEPEDYVHRIGRTARADAEGDAITLVTPDDEPAVHGIEYLLGHKIERRVLPGFDYDVPAPSWARPSVAALLRQIKGKQSAADRWRSMG